MMGESKEAVRAEYCPNFINHTPSPGGYLQWHAWAKRMSRTHKQERCSGCGLYTIWVRRARPLPENSRE